MIATTLQLPSPTTDDLPATAGCLNCGHALVLPRPNYCAECGQETRVRPPTMGEFIQQFGGSYIAAEGALWRTLRQLILKPGGLTREYLDGRRRRYVLPLRLYLTISLIVFVLLRALTAVNVGAIDKMTAGQAPTNVVVQLGFGEVRISAGNATCTDVPGWLCERIKKRLNVDPKQYVREISGLIDRTLSNVGAAMFVLLPAFALWLKLVYRNRAMRYTEHLVFALHVHAFWFAMLGLMLIDLSWLDAVAFAAIPVYTWLAMRRVYGGRWRARLLRSGVVSVLYALTLVPTLAALTAWAILF